MFSELWFDDEDHSIAVDNIDRNVLYENKLLGVARLHMVSEFIIIGSPLGRTVISLFMYFSYESPGIVVEFIQNLQIDTKPVTTFSIKILKIA